MRVAFLLKDLQLSGGVGVVVEHARQLVSRHGFDVTLAMTHEQEDPDWDFRGLEHLHVLPLEQAREHRYDVAVATWWETAYRLFDLPAERYAHFVQSLEDRFYEPGMLERSAAAFVLDLPVHFITEARWIADTLGELQPGARCFYVRNGVAKDMFPVPEGPEPRGDGPLRILIEGNRHWRFKGVDDALAATAGMREARHVTLVTPNHGRAHDTLADEVVGPVSHAELAGLYRQTDVVLKLSRVEGMFAPPLEGFHCGATCVVTPVTGHEEYIVHGWNGLLADWDDLGGTARLLDLLARDRELLHFLRFNAVETARAWPSTEQSSMFMAGALRKVAGAPAAGERVRGAGLAMAFQSTLEAQRLHLRHTTGGIEATRAYRLALRLRRLRHSRPLNLLLTPLKPPVRALRRYRVRRASR